MPRKARLEDDQMAKRIDAGREELITCLRGIWQQRQQLHLAEGKCYAAYANLQQEAAKYITERIREK